MLWMWFYPLNRSASPHAEPFQFDSLVEIREYLAGDRIQCLVCGKKYLRLTHRQLSLHAMTGDDYREMFGIPWTYSLTSAASRSNLSRRNNFANMTNLPYRRPVGEIPASRRKRTPAVTRYWTEVVRPQGPTHSAQLHEMVPCDDCGVDVPTTRLTKVHGTRCVACRVIAKQARDAAKAALLLPRCA